MKKAHAAYLLLIIVLSVPLFAGLATMPVRLWDESRQAISAYEMYRSNNFIVTTFLGDADMWNTKPPLLLWMITLSYHIFGVNEWGLRLPSAFMALGTCLFLYGFIKKRSGNGLFAFLTAFILVTAQGYVSIHGSRTGDFDTTLTFFTTLYGLCFFSYLETKRKNHLYATFIFMALAVLTKSISALLFLPGLFLYLLLQGQVGGLLKCQHFYYGLLIFLVIVAGFYSLREYYNPGYIHAVYINELGGRYFNTIEDHNHGFWYYIGFIGSPRFVDWILFFVTGIFLNTRNREPLTKKLVAYAAIMALSFLLIISSAKTKLLWYDIPIYPFMSIVSAYALTCFYAYLQKRFSQQRYSFARKNMPIIIMVMILLIPYTRIILKFHPFKEKEGDVPVYALSAYLKHSYEAKKDLNGIHLITEGYAPHILFYTLMFREKGVNIPVSSVSDLKENDRVITAEPQAQKVIEENFNYQILEAFDNVTVYLIRDEKK